MLSAVDGIVPDVSRRELELDCLYVVTWYWSGRPLESLGSFSLFLRSFFAHDCVLYVSRACGDPDRRAYRVFGSARLAERELRLGLLSQTIAPSWEARGQPLARAVV